MSTVTKKTYELPEPVHTELVDPFGERFEFAADAGVVTAKNEHDEIALEHLVRVGMARPTAAKTGGKG